MADAAVEESQVMKPRVKTRRAKTLFVKPEEFMVLFTKGMEFRKRTRIMEGIPEDAKLLALSAEPIRHGIIMVVESAEYDEVPVTELPPFVEVKIQTKFGATKRAKR